jgi:hypothetical protein
VQLLEVPVCGARVHIVMSDTPAAAIPVVVMAAWTVFSARTTTLVPQWRSGLEAPLMPPSLRVSAPLISFLDFCTFIWGPAGNRSD